jgi:NADH:ubiquinone oxidoreductase subunit 6 (subunit J)
MLYIGAVAIIFLFAVMFIDLRLEDTWVDVGYTENYSTTLIIFFKLLLSLQLITNDVVYFLNSDVALSPGINFFYNTDFVYNFSCFFNDILCIANLLYTHYLLYLVLLSLVLWGVMLGSISICTRYK